MKTSKLVITGMILASMISFGSAIADPVQTVVVQRPLMKVIGIQVRTNNKDETGPQGKIGPTWQKFYSENMGTKIPNQVHPETILAIYTDYESDVNGEYSFVLGKEVENFDTLPSGMVAKTLPASKYAAFTSPRGVIPGIVIDLWKYIWGIKSGELGSNRAYLGDYEVYDARSSNPENAQIDIFLSIN